MSGDVTPYWQKQMRDDFAALVATRDLNGALVADPDVLTESCTAAEVQWAYATADALMEFVIKRDKTKEAQDSMGSWYHTKEDHW